MFGMTEQAGSRKEAGDKAERRRIYLSALFIVTLGLLLILTFVGRREARAQPASGTPGEQPRLSQELDQGEAFCLNCHSLTGLSLTLPSGETLNLYVDKERYLASVHGDKLTCADCHQGYTSLQAHPSQVNATRRDYTIARYEICKRCHFINYTRTLDSIHFETLAAGNLQAALCVDCHGAHYVSPAGKPRAGISQTCAQCHQSIYQTYVGSVHGAALIEENNQDVPVCTDCHGVHNIHDPRTAAFRLSTPELCGGCHSDEQLMAKYGLSTRVLQTYLQDFHGVTNRLLQEQSPQIWTEKAVCTDCHGIHDITRTDDPESRVIRANLVETCRNCHPGATDNFPAAWLSHYEPDWDKAPLVYVVRLFYRFFIPFVVGGLALHILLDLWRIATGR